MFHVPQQDAADLTAGQPRQNVGPAVQIVVLPRPGYLGVELPDRRRGSPARPIVEKRGPA